MPVVVFGAGDIAVEVMVRLSAHYQVVALADNDPAKHGRLVMGRPVLAAEALADLSFDAIFIALVSRHHPAVKTQLATLGLSAKVAELPPEVSLAAIEAAQASRLPEIYNPYASAAGQHHLRQVHDFQLQHAAQAPYPNVFFINMTCSGGSAIDPVLRSILASRWYFLPPFGPEGSGLVDFFPHQPFYHWSHAGVSQFSQYLQRPDCKFIFMHRDLRDTAVSIANDYLGRLGEPAFPAMLQLTVSCYLKPPVTIALEWLRQHCLVITFDEMKASTPAVIRRILDHCGIDDVTDAEIEQHAAAHSFERMTGRQRGEEGDAIRTGYFWRKGVSGGWRNHFDQRLTDEFKYLYGDALVTLGYETDLDW